MQSRFDTNESTDLVDFHAADLLDDLRVLDPDALDRLPFGVIGFDRSTAVRIYNRYEAHAAGLSVSRVVGKPFFDDVAPCMNNYLVAQRFMDAWAAMLPLDATLGYVLTLRMRPVSVDPPAVRPGGRSGLRAGAPTRHERLAGRADRRHAGCRWIRAAPHPRPFRIGKGSRCGACVGTLLACATAGE